MNEQDTSAETGSVGDSVPMDLMAVYPWIRVSTWGMHHSAGVRGACHSIYYKRTLLPAFMRPIMPSTLVLV